MSQEFPRAPDVIRDPGSHRRGRAESQRAGGATGDGERHAIHQAEAQPQGECGEEGGGATAGAKVSRVQLTTGPEVKRLIASKALDRFQQRIREITRRAKSVSTKTTIEELAPYMRAGIAISAFAKRPSC
jgi:hypothetical protein